MDWLFEDDYQDSHEASLFGATPSPPSLPPPPPRASTLRPPSRGDPYAFDSNDECSQLLRSLSPAERGVLPAQLNPMQSSLCLSILGNDRGVVVSAPTGAGKTCLLDMALLRAIITNQPQGLRAYYVAPSRALCRLQANGFTKRFRAVNVDVVIHTGDDDEVERSEAQAVKTGDFDELEQRRKRVEQSSNKFSKSTSFDRSTASGAARHQLVACTPEKLEAETRKLTDEKIRLNKRCLLLIDEIHHVGEKGRGATLEMTIARFMWAFRGNQNDLRFVAISATVPNLDEIARWLGNAEAFEFRDRPIPLTVRVLGYPCPRNKAEYLFEKDLDRHVMEVLTTYGKGKPALVFVGTRKNAKELAERLAETMPVMAKPPTRAGSLIDRQGMSMSAVSQIVTDDPALQKCLLAGFGYHSAGLSNNDRILVETMFAQSKLRVVCCTSTLAVGVDLPASLVVVKSVRAYRGTKEGFQDLERATLIQMIGRAGRRGHDTEGFAVIMCAEGTQNKYMDMTNGLLPVESQLIIDTYALMEGVNAEIVRGRLTSRDDCRLWWAATLASQRMPWSDERLNDLIQFGCVDENTTTGSIQATSVGKIASTHHLRLATVADFAKICNRQGLSLDDGANQLDSSSKSDKIWDLERAARVLCQAAEFDDLVLRRDQKKFLNDVASTHGRFKSLKSFRVQDPKEMAFQLLQCRLGGVAVQDMNLRQQSSFVFERAPRLARALLKMLVDAKSNRVVVCALLCKCLESQCWETDELSQLNGVGMKTREKLMAGGLLRLRDAISTGTRPDSLPVKALAQAKSVLASQKIPIVSMSSSALVVTMQCTSPNGAAAAAKVSVSMQRFGGAEYWISCIGVNASGTSRLIGWAEIQEKVVFPVQNLKRVTVFAIHRKWHGLDSKLVVDLNVSGAPAALPMINIRSQDCESKFWDGFFLADEMDSGVCRKPKSGQTKKRVKAAIIEDYNENLQQHENKWEQQPAKPVELKPAAESKPTATPVRRAPIMKSMPDEHSAGNSRTVRTQINSGMEPVEASPTFLQRLKSLAYPSVDGNESDNRKEKQQQFKRRIETAPYATGAISQRWPEQQLGSRQAATAAAAYLNTGQNCAPHSSSCAEQGRVSTSYASEQHRAPVVPPTYVQRKTMPTAPPMALAPQRAADVVPPPRASSARFEDVFM